MCIKREVGVQVDPYLISLHGYTGDVGPDTTVVAGELLASEYLLHGQMHEFSIPNLVELCVGENHGSLVLGLLQSNISEQVEPTTTFSSQLAVRFGYSKVPVKANFLGGLSSVKLDIGISCDAE